MSTATTASATTAPTEFLRVKDDTYAYRRIGGGFRRPLLCLQHFTGTVPTTVAGMAAHALAFLDGLCVTSCDVLGRHAAVKTSCTWTSQVWPGTSAIRPSKATPCCRGFFLRRPRRARRRVERSSSGSPSVKRISTHRPEQTSPPHSWRRSASGSNRMGHGSPN